MRRLHLFEIEDQPWCPRVIRDAGTDFLEKTQDMVSMFAPIVPLLGDAMQRLGDTRVVDLCSGGAGPWAHVLRGLRKRGLDATLTLTDLYPNERAFDRAEAVLGSQARGHRQSVDATQVPEALQGFRTIFNAFHHFRPELAAAVLKDAVRQRQGIAIFESVEPRMAPSALFMPLNVAVITPLLRPLSWPRLALTYLLPLIPLMVMWDGFVSMLRVYSPRALEELTASLGDVGYEWSIGRVKATGPLRITYLIGTPKERVRS